MVASVETFIKYFIPKQRIATTVVIAKNEENKLRKYQSLETLLNHVLKGHDLKKVYRTTRYLLATLRWATC